MKRHLQLALAFTTTRYNERSWSIGLPVAGADVVPLVCEIALLLYDRSNQLSLLFDRDRKLILYLTDSLPKVAGSVEAPTALHPDRNNLEYLTSFLLQSYRDGIAPGNHIDIELAGAPSSGEDCTLYVHIPDSTNHK